ncbi:MAG: sigma-54-dependent Fis family transcriptional regulator [Magnetococcales bacterium]|nr:sigma-54-dependent Fis family transcriptional regulator [Magnetococcales bacterium]
MLAIFDYLEKIAPSSQPVLIHGETGVGKELLVAGLHRASGLAGPLIAINVAGIDGAMFSDTLFGHVRGAYSGAEGFRQGMVAEAQGGTLFLDEIGDLGTESQVKLLRLLQENLYYPLGSDTPRGSDARIVCATNVDLKAQVDRGTFRADLYYRLSAHQVSIPPLRERMEDIPLLVDHFVTESAQAMNRTRPAIATSFLEALAAHPFPGNIRELQALVHDAVACHNDGELGMDNTAIGRLVSHRPFGRGEESGLEETANLFRGLSGPLPTFREAERLLMAEALRRSGGSQGVAAAMLGISRTALNRRIQMERRKR